MKKLPDSELEVMQALWEIKTPAKRSDIENHLNQTHSYATTTILTLLSRLNEKGFISIKKEGKVAYYNPLVKQEDYLSNLSNNIFTQVFKSDISAFASALTTSISADDLVELKKLLEEYDV